MDASQYYITTLTAAVKNLAPYAIFLVGGYLVFIKLPFMFFLKNLKETKQEFEQNQRLGDDSKKSYRLEDYEDFQRRMKLMNAPKEEPKKEEVKKEESKTRFQEKKKEEPKKEQPKAKPKPQPQSSSAEELFEFKPGQTFTQQELKKKYHDLLKMNHPDKVASMGPDFKKMAEMKTKDINSAYMKLKKLAA